MWDDMLVQMKIKTEEDHFVSLNTMVPWKEGTCFEDCKGVS